MTELHSAMWGTSGETQDGYVVMCWRGAYSGMLIVQVNYPPGGPFRAACQGHDTEAAAAAWAEAEIRAERARRAQAA